LELKPKTLRSALLSGEAGSTLAHIAYTVDGKVKRGTYDISVNSIQLEMPGGDIIPEPAIVVPVRLNRWGVGNEAVTAPASTAYAYGGTLYIQSPHAEQVTVYSLTGAKVYEGAVQAGTTTVNAARLPKGVYIVAFGDGTRQKVWVSE
ncbi:MAG: T9SS type A sorting domain-containing protein, partial [Tannerella sp.]|nr:T9SS type A sorting domain-containing protein [Tannerella sp.]